MSPQPGRWGCRARKRGKIYLDCGREEGSRLVCCMHALHTDGEESDAEYTYYAFVALRYFTFTYCMKS